MTPERTIVDTAQGPGELLWSPADDPRAVLVLGHGAGGGVASWDLTALAARLPAAGISVVRFVQPWLLAGRKVAVRPPLLDDAWLPALEAVGRVGGPAPLVTGGRSAGARVACRTANETGALGVLCLSFPLHPPGRPERTRVDELLVPRVPRLVVQGERDPFGSGAEIRQAVAESTADLDGTGIALMDVADARHDLRPAARSGVTIAKVCDELTARVLDWVDELTE